jgi:hypothetical protein
VAGVRGGVGGVTPHGHVGGGVVGVGRVAVGREGGVVGGLLGEVWGHARVRG